MLNQFSSNPAARASVCDLLVLSDGALPFINPTTVEWSPVAPQSQEAVTHVATFDDLAAPFRSATNVMDLAAVLNAALQLEMAGNPGCLAEPVYYRLLEYYAFHKRGGRYHTFFIPKCTPGEMRQIKAPDKVMLQLQRLLLRCLTATFTTCDEAAHGFVTGRSVLTNALPHTRRRYVLNVDLENFFPSTPVQRVVKVLQLAPFKLAKPVAHIVANLCCDQGSLPQGAPTSPLLTNAVCQRMDHRLRQFARRHHCTYTRYADDLTFSSNRPAFRERFRHELDLILESEGYRQNMKKWRLQMPNQRQEVTGVIVNERPNVPREYVRQIRAMLHNWETKGYAIANATLRQHYRNDVLSTLEPDKILLRHHGHMPQLARVLSGKIAYLGMIRGIVDPVFIRLRQQLHDLNASWIEE